MNLQRLIIAAVSLNLGLGGLSGGVLAQTNSGLVVIDDASGTDGTASGNCEISGSRRTGRSPAPICAQATGSRSPTRARRQSRSPRTSRPTSAPPAPEAASAPETTDAAVATATDQDADNAPDELEPGLGLDPTNPDTDGDHVADGDELNIYGTDPLNADTDGDGVTDGEELFATHTDPLV